MTNDSPSVATAAKAFLAVGCLSLAACSGEGSGPTDAGAGDASAAPVDAGAAADAGPPDAGATCTRDGYDAVRGQALVTEDRLSYAGVSVNGAPFDVLRIDIYEAFDGPSEPGVYSLDGINYADCGLCVRILANCDGEGGCEKTFYAEQGEVEITEIDAEGRFSAKLRNLVFDEVTIESETFLSTPVPDGETWCVGDFDFDEPALDPEETQCARDDVHCVGETIPDFALQNCGTGEMVDFSTMVEGDEAAWVVLTAGWCPACREWMPQVVALDEQRSSDGLEVIYVLGEDNRFRTPTLEYCREYASAYGGAEHFYIDHDGRSSFATTYRAMWFYLDSNGAFGLPFNAVIDPATREYMYADGAGEGSLSETLDALLGR